MITYDPKDAVQTLPAGEYNAVLEKYEEKLSKKGNQMAVLTWKVFDANSDRTPFVTDYIVFPAFTFKLKKLAKSLGKLADFESKVFQPEDYVGASTRVFLDVESQEGYDDKNVIGNYLPLAEDSVPAGKFAKPADGPKDSDIPF